MIGVRCLGRRVEVPSVRVLFKKILQIFVHADIEQVPVVQTGALHAPVVELKAERFDQMQHTARRRTGARDVAGVLRDLRLDQNDIDHLLFSPENGGYAVKNFLCLM